MIRDYLRRLAAELESRGVARRSRARVLAEAEDHLSELAAEHGEEDAIRRFGESRPLADEVAAQLATIRTIRSTYAAFAALVFTAVGYLAFLGYVEHSGRDDLFAGNHEAVGVAASLALGLFPQIAFVAGALALVRALRRRRGGALSREELGVMRRRSALALGAGAVTLASIALWALEFDGSAYVVALGAAAAVPLGFATAWFVRASGPQALTGGPPEDVFDDLHLEALRDRPWLFALGVALTAAALALAVDGLAIAALELTAILVCFAFLGRTLALRA